MCNSYFIEFKKKQLDFSVGFVWLLSWQQCCHVTQRLMLDIVLAKKQHIFTYYVKTKYHCSLSTLLLIVHLFCNKINMVYHCYSQSPIIAFSKLEQQRKVFYNKLYCFLRCQ